MLFISLEMDSEQITRCLSNVPGFLGVFARDNLSEIKTRDNFSVIVNTDASAEPGRHWVAIVVQNNVCHVFCSVGEEPRSDDIVAFCRRFSSCFFNAEVPQSASEITCAAYAIYVICEMSKGVPFEGIVKHFHTICNDDSFVRSYLNERFGYSIGEAWPSRTVHLANATSFMQQQGEATISQCTLENLSSPSRIGILPFSQLQEIWRH